MALLDFFMYFDRCEENIVYVLKEMIDLGVNISVPINTSFCLLGAY